MSDENTILIGKNIKNIFEFCKNSNLKLIHRSGSLSSCINELFWSEYEVRLLKEKILDFNLGLPFKMFQFTLETKGNNLFLGSDLESNVLELTRSFPCLFDGVEKLSIESAYSLIKNILLNSLYKNTVNIVSNEEALLPKDYKVLLSNSENLYHSNHDFKDLISAVGSIHLGIIKNNYDSFELLLILLKLLSPSYILEVDPILDKTAIGRYSVVDKIDLETQDDDSLRIITKGYEKTSIVKKSNIFTSDIRTSGDSAFRKVSLIKNESKETLQNKIEFNRENYFKNNSNFLKIDFGFQDQFSITFDRCIKPKNDDKSHYFYFDQFSQFQNKRAFCR